MIQSAGDERPVDEEALGHGEMLAPRGPLAVTRPELPPGRRGHCLPAGHASGGFGLLGFVWIRRSRRWRIAWLTVALVAGWSMGLVQMLNGSHYLSHTMVTMLLAWWLAVLWHTVIGSPTDTVISGEPG
jgi:membrane-associated PAP2 superfamily phosphatase